MSTRDHYNDLPQSVPDAVKDGRQLMNDDYRAAFETWAALQASLMLGYMPYIGGVVWTQMEAKR